MRFLIADIPSDGIQVRRTHAESGVPFLPSEPNPLLSHPFRRVCLEKLNRFGQCDLWRQVKKKMHVIFRGANYHKNRLKGFAYAGEVRPKLRLHLGGDQIAALFGAKNQMDVIPGVRVGHLCRPSGACSTPSSAPTAGAVGYDLPSLRDLSMRLNCLFRSDVLRAKFARPWMAHCTYMPRFILAVVRFSRVLGEFCHCHGMFGCAILSHSYHCSHNP